MRISLAVSKAQLKITDNAGKEVLSASTDGYAFDVDIQALIGGVADLFTAVAAAEKKASAEAEPTIEAEPTADSDDVVVASSIDETGKVKHYASIDEMFSDILSGIRDK